MKWKVIDTKTNVATNKTTDYKLNLEAVTNGNMLTVTVTVDKKPAKIKPVNWTGPEIKKMVEGKGFSIAKTLTRSSLTNDVTNSKVYTYELVPKKIRVAKSEATKTTTTAVKKRATTTRRKTASKTRQTETI